MSTGVHYNALKTLIYAVLTVLEAPDPGSLLTVAIISYALLGTSAGCTSASLYKTLCGKKWKKNFFMTAIACPGCIFGIFVVLNTVLWINDSSAVLPFKTFLTLLALWLCVSTPLVFICAYLGSQFTMSSNPIGIIPVLHHINKNPFFIKLLTGIVISSALPSSLVYTRRIFMVKGVWFNTYNSPMVSLFAPYIILIITCAEIGIIVSYLQLRAKNYNWWWQSFLTPGFHAAYFFLSSVHYVLIKLAITDVTSVFLYTG
ncbi:unnamed protein product, partial [Rotaria magnacalcarata]